MLTETVAAICDDCSGSYPTLPASSYLHRAGFAAKYGRQGTVVSFVNPDEYNILQEVERQLGIRVEELPPNLEELLHIEIEEAEF